MDPIWTENPRRGGWAGFAVRLTLLLALWAPLPVGVAGAVMLLRLADSVPAVPNLDELQPAHGSRIVLMDGTLLAGAKAVKPVPFDELDPIVLGAFLAAEDENFFSHDAFSARAIFRAAWENWRAGKTVQGASTITQQVARRFLTNEKTYARKVQELLIARRIEAAYRKEAILEAYLRSVAFGSPEGLTNAAWFYFDKDPRELTVPEAAVLAGMLPAPSVYNPVKSVENATRERNRVLRRMFETGMISQRQHDEYVAQPIVLPTPTPLPVFRDIASTGMRVLEDKYGEDAWASGGITVVMPEMPSATLRGAAAIQQAVEALDRRQGFKPVGRTEKPDELDLALAKQVDGDESKPSAQPSPESPDFQWPVTPQLARVVEVTRDELVVQAAERHTLLRKDNDWASPASEPRHYKRPNKLKAWTDILKPNDVVWVRVTDGKASLWQNTDFEGALVMQDAQTGHILASAGSAHPGTNDFDRVWQACRQPGSTFKPIVFAEALSRGIHAATMLSDVPVEVNLGHGKIWEPKNADRDFKGYMTLASALAWSRNLPTVNVAQHIGMPVIVARARKMGIDSMLDPTISTALGASCLRPYELARVYSAFQRGGIKADAAEVAWFERPDGTVEYDQTPFGSPDIDPLRRLDRLVTVGPEPVAALSPAVAFVMEDLLRRVVTNGTAHDLPDDWLVGGKTGTTNQHDVWFAGIDGRYTTVIWVGADENARPLGDGEHGATAAMPAFATFFEPTARRTTKTGHRPTVTAKVAELGPDSPDDIYPANPPEGVEYKDVDISTGLLTPPGEFGTPYPFIRGSGPREFSPPKTTRQAQQVDALMYEF